METRTELQPLLTLESAGGTGEGEESVIQHQSDWLDTGADGAATSYALFALEIFDSDKDADPAPKSRLILEQAETEDGPFEAFEMRIGEATAEAFLSVLSRSLPFGERNRLRRLIRWRWEIPNSPGTYYVCFRLTVVLKP